MKVHVIGKEFKSGVSKKSGNPYEFSVVYLAFPKLGVDGYAVGEVSLNSQVCAYGSIKMDKDYDLQRDFQGRIIGFTEV